MPGDLIVKSEDAARLLRVMGHVPRLRILCALAGQPLSSGEIARAIGAREPATSQQLALLRAEGLVAARRDGQRVIYAVASPFAGAVLAVLRECFCEPGEGAGPDALAPE